MFFYLLVAIKPGSRSKSEVNYRSLGEMCSLAVLRQGRRSKEGPRGWGGREQLPHQILAESKVS